MSDGYRRQRNIYGNYGGGLLVTPFVSTTTLVTVLGPRLGVSQDGQYTIYVQRVHVHVSTPQAATTWNVRDSNGNSLTGVLSVASGPTQDPIAAEYDFGATGIALSAGSNLVLDINTPGAAGVVTWDAYQKTSSTTGFGV